MPYLPGVHRPSHFCKEHTISQYVTTTDENIGAVNVELTPDDLHELEEAAAKIQIQGARLPEAVLKLTGR